LFFLPKLLYHIKGYSLSSTSKENVCRILPRTTWEDSSALASGVADVNLFTEASKYKEALGASLSLL
jgi:hypothetical protein